jgi:hypothetical protein
MATGDEGLKAVEGSNQTLKRRGLFALGVAAVVGAVLKQTTRVVQAATGMMFQDTPGGSPVPNVAGGNTYIYSTAAYTDTLPTVIAYAFQGNASAGLCGISGAGSPVAPLPCGLYGTQNKVTGASPTTAGIVGDNAQSTGIGVLGRNGSGGSLGDGHGVRGESGGGVGCYGQIPNTSTKNALGVLGANFSTFTGAGPGGGGFGVYGVSAKGHGLVGSVVSAGAAAIAGSTEGTPGAYAAILYGPVFVGGALTVTGAKSAAVPHPDGSHRRLYCVESPESWFEDFGEASLECGEAVVSLDPDYTAIVETTKYHVFLTGHDDFDLRVSDRRPGSFRVAARDPKSSGSFSWRVVAKRKDIEGPRFENVEVPAEPVLPKISPEPTPSLPQRGDRLSTRPGSPIA